MENEQNLNRIPVIDIMRGLGIILVVMGISVVNLT